jgi:Tn3 transposase DDE domain
VPLIDMVTEAALRTGMLGHLTAVGSREALERSVLWERLLLIAYAYGTNTGISAAAAGDHGHSEADLRDTARRYFTIDGARAVAIQLANATFAARQSEIWGQSTTIVASDSTPFRAYDQNLFTEWHSRYGGRGVLIYWLIEKKSMVVHSQLLSCAASEVAAMVEGAVRHGTAMELEGNYVDSHGQSEIGFAITRLLGFDLLPRIKQINKVKLYQPDRGDPAPLHPQRLAPRLPSDARTRTRAEDDLHRALPPRPRPTTRNQRRPEPDRSVDILAEPEWAGVLTAEDLRGLTPLFWAHVRPYGEVRLNMTRRLALSASHTPDLDRESA